MLRLAPADDTAMRRLAAIWLRRGDAMVSANDFEAARDAFRRALDHEPEAASQIQTGLTARAEEAARVERFDHGASTFNLLLQLFSENDEARAHAAAFLVKYGAAREAEGHLDDAIALYAKVAELSPTDDSISGRLDAARTKLRERQTIAAIAATFERSMAAHRAGNMAEARDSWKALIQKGVLSYEGQNIAVFWLGRRPSLFHHTANLTAHSTRRGTCSAVGG